MAVKIFYAFLTLIGGIAYGLLLGGISRKITARMQNRRGPTIFQNFIDVWKLFRKKTAISHGVMFYLAPMFRLFGGAGTFLLIPVVIDSPYLSNFSFGGDLLVVMYFMVFGCLGMALGAAESGHPHAPIAVTRGLSQMAGYELPFVISVVVLMVADKTTTIEGIVRAQQGGILHWHLFTHPFAAAAAFVSLLGMMMSYPFQVVMAPQEIPVGPPTEYSATFLSYMFSGRSVFAVAKYVLFMDLFLGGATNLLWAFVKTFIIFLWPLFITNVFPRFRLEQSVLFFWTWPTLIGLIDLIRIFIVR